MSTVLGLDFGSLSVRAAVIDTESGKTLRTAESAYAHGFIEGVFPPTGEKLPDGWTLQQPQDWLDSLKEAVRAVNARDVVGVGLDFTAPTIVPLTADGTPLCFLDEFKAEKHAYAKKWKHIAPAEAERLSELADMELLSRFGGKMAAESTFAKIWQTLKGAPRVYEAAARFAEAGDWVAQYLTGKPVCARATACYKELWDGGYPSREFFAAADPRLSDLPDKLYAPDAEPGVCVGGVCGSAAWELGLPAGAAVACPIIDAHAAIPAAGVTGAGVLLSILGTSACHLTLGDTLKSVPGILAVVENGMLPGSYGYEASQISVGDCFAWFTENCVPRAYAEEAERRGLGLHGLMTEKAARLRPGENGLVALDWWNGNRSVLLDGSLTGLIAGLTVGTAPEDVYRALLESTAYGMRKIVDNYEAHGVPVTAVRACGGIAVKNALMMQIYADVLGKDVTVVNEPLVGARGAAIHAAVAAGAHADFTEAIAAMACRDETVYRPTAEHLPVYDELYAEYDRLYEQFGRQTDTLKRLKAIKEKAKK